MVLVCFFLPFYPRYILNDPHAMIGPPMMPSNDGPLDSPVIESSQQGRIGDRLVHSTRKIFKETIRKFHQSSQNK